MKKLIIQRYGKLPKLIQTQIPQLLKSECLVRMKYAPINPSDLGFLFGAYGFRRQLPCNFGFQGSGIIEKAQSQQMIGKKVSLFVPRIRNEGTYATHIVIPESAVSIWPDEANLEQVSCSVVNPMTVVGFSKLVKKQKYKNILLSAANSQLCRMLIKYFSKNKICKVNGIVRNQDQISDLLSLGADKVFMDQSNFDELKQMQPTIFFDSVGGPQTSTIFSKLPPSSVLVTYGNISKQPDISINARQLIFSNKKVRGFWLVQLLEEMTQRQYEEMKREVVQNSSDFSVKIKSIVELENHEQAIKLALRGGSDGKVLLKM